LEWVALVVQGHMLLGLEGDLLQAQLQALLVDGLQEATPHLLVDLETSPQNPIRFILEEKRHGLLLSVRTVIRHPPPPQFTPALRLSPLFFPCIPCDPWFPLFSPLQRFPNVVEQLLDDVVGADAVGLGP